MRKDKQKALGLRREGKSYNQIGNLLNIPKSTLSDWFKYDIESQQVKNFLTAVNRGISKARLIRLDKVRGQALDQIYKEAEVEAKSEFNLLKYHPLFIAGLMIYWGEGTKSIDQRINISNTDPAMIKVFHRFLMNICNAPLDKIKCALLLYPDLDESECHRYWVTNTSVPLENFTKSTIIQGRHQKRRLQYGICMISFSSKYLKTKLLLWMSIMSEKLLDDKYYAGII